MKAMLCIFSALILTLSFHSAAENKPKSKLKVSGKLMLDYDDFDPVFNKNESGDDTYLRRVRLSAEYKFNDLWQTKLQVSYDEKDDEFEEKELSLTYKGFDYFDVKLGKFKEPFGLENTTSSKNLLSIERSMASNSFAPGRSYGLGISKLKKKYTWAIGIFDATNEDDLFEQLALTSRLTYLPIKSDNSLLHLGFSGTYREGQAQRYQINESMEVYSAKKVVESPYLPVDIMVNYGIEAAWQHNSLLVQGEYFQQTIDVKNNFGSQDSDYSGYYLQASYFLTGEQHKYKKGRFTTLSPKHDYGAIEFIARYSVLDAESNKRGHQAENSMIGVNYYFSKNIRLMLNYIHGELEGVNARLTDSGDAFSARLQYAF